MEKLRHIHLIDDDQTFCFLAKKILNQSDFRADMQISVNGKAALDYLDAVSKIPELRSPDIIILDINMPVMNGWDFLEDFKSMKKQFDGDITVLVLSSSVDPDDKTKALSYEEVTDYIAKPLTVDFFNNLEKRYL